MPSSSPCCPSKGSTSPTEYPFTGAAPACCPEWEGASEGLLSQHGVQIHTGDALSLSSVLYTESTPGIISHLQLLTPCSFHSQGVQSLSHSLLFSVRLSTSVSWIQCRCLHRRTCPHLQLVQRGCAWLHGVARGPQVGAGEMWRQEGGETWTAAAFSTMQGINLCCPIRESGFNENFKKYCSLSTYSPSLPSPTPLSGASSGTLFPMTELPGQPYRGSLMGLQF